MRFEQAYDPFRALRSSFDLIGRAPLALLLGGVLVVLTGVDAPDVGLTFSTEWGLGFEQVRVVRRDGVPMERRELVVLLAFGALGLAVAILLWLLNTLLHVGYARCVERALDGEPDRAGPLIEPRGRFLHLLLTRVLVWLIWLGVGVPLWAVLLLLAILSDGFALWAIPAVGALVLWIPVLVYVGLGLALVPKATAVEGLAPLEALQRGWGLARGNRLHLLLYYVALFLVELLGLCLCCFGVLLTGAWTQATAYESYLRLVRGERAAAA